MNNFSIYENTVPTNEDILITFTPDENILRYTYRIYRADELISSIRVDSNESSLIKLDSTGSFTIKVEAFNGIENIEYVSGKYLVDKQAPSIKVGEPYLKLKKGDTLKVMGNVKAIDNFDGDVTNKITTNANSIDASKIGKEHLVYTVSDRAGNTISKTVTLEISNSNIAVVVGIQLTVIIILFMIMNRLSGYLSSIRMDKRFGKYAVEPNVDDIPSLYDVVFNFYDNLVKSLGGVLRRSTIIKRYSKRYNKYLLFNKEKYTDSTDIVASKILISLIFLIIAVIIKALEYKTINVYECIIPFIIGYFVLDIYYIFKNKIYRSRIENDLLQAVIIMNNAFKSGRSIVQAIDLVGRELPGIIGNQFIIMKKELSKGLSLDVVFSRFASRVDVEEVNYLTASLSILNKTGGNIIKVFDAIENSLFMKKKLRLELESLTGSSKIIMWILFLIPIAYVLIISLLNPAYFDPFFNTTLGVILITIGIILYVVYIFIVRKILKVRM